MKGGIVSGPHATIYDHLSAEEHRLELERTREELRNVKKLLTERDAEILQLKTAHRKLQDALRKKDKDLQNVFSVLRAPQDAELTKKRKAELVDRLLVETQQRMVNAEAVAEDRKRELDKLKFSSKFLRFQELDIEIDECHTEMERLRSELSQYAVVGKLKISTRSSSAEGRKPSTVSKPKRIFPESNGAPLQQYREQVVTPIAVASTIPTALNQSRKRENFVERTRRRAVEAEYQKQVRLAQLEAECELEENLRVLVKREAAAQAELRLQKPRHDRRSRLERVAALPVVGPPMEAKENPTVEAATELVAKEPPLLEPTEVTVASAVHANGTPKHLPSSEEETETGTVAGVVEEAGVVEQTEESASQHRDASSAVAEKTEPKQYDNDGFDDGAEDDDDDSVVDCELPVEKEASSGEYEPVHDEVDDDVDVDDEIGEPVVADIPSTVVDEIEDEDSQDGPRKEAEAAVPESPIESDEEQEEADDGRPVQGFLLDPVNTFQVPSSDPWMQTPADLIIPVNNDAAIQVIESLEVEKGPVPGSPVADALSEEEPEEVHQAVQQQGFLLDPVNQVEAPSSLRAQISSAHTVETARDIQEVQLQGSQETGVPESPIDDAVLEHEEDKRELEAHVLEPQQGFLLDPVDTTLVLPSSDPWPQTVESTSTVAVVQPVPPVEEEADSVGEHKHEETMAQDDEHIQPEDAAVEEGEADDRGHEEPDAVERSTPSQPEKTAEADARKPTVSSSVKPSPNSTDDNEEMAEPDDATDRSIGSALTAAASETSPSTHRTTASGMVGLCMEELTLAMDAAARKLQKFWRDMDAKYATKTQPVEVDSAPAASVDEPTVTMEQETVAESPECVESLITSEADMSEW